ncbi:MAG TPA: hypothetical protein PLD55_06100 [bacterium]|nr:hypothetical protein [bacterium]HQM84240.1 hypothetical protein [bacterium]
MHNPDFNITEFGNIKNEAGSNEFNLYRKNWTNKKDLGVTLTLFAPQVTPQVTMQVNMQDTMQDTMQVTMQVKQLVIMMKGEKSRDELQKELKIKNRDYFRKAYIIPALEAELIEYTIPDKPNSRLQKYRLTALGKKVRADLEKKI